MRGGSSLLAKVDHPDDRWLMEMLWKESLFIDTTIPFSLHSAPKIFTVVADAAKWILRQAGVNFG